jgi:DNA-binding beta-propeller fold protein YncE
MHVKQSIQFFLSFDIQKEFLLRIFGLVIVISFMSLLNVSCMKDDMLPVTEFNTSGQGVFIVCEGNFMYGNASLSYYDKINDTVENTIFLRANGIPLGDVAQSISVFDSLAYIVVNNSGKIYSINLSNFRFSGKITELVSPRYMLVISSSRAFVSDMYSGKITEVNPSQMKATGQINLNYKNTQTSRYSSEQMIVFNNLLYTNSWSFNDMIYIIDIDKSELADSIQVLTQPRKMLLDRYNKIWVLCDGGFAGSAMHGESGIVRIDAESREVEQYFVLGIDASPVDMKINARGDSIYFVNEHVYRFHVNASQLPSLEFINSDGRNIYAIGIDPDNSDVYIADAVDFMQSGEVYRYNSSGQLITSFTVGIIPNSFVFK